MTVEIKHIQPVDAPIESVTLSDYFGTRQVSVRPTSDVLPGGRTIQCDGPAAHFKFVATLGDLRAFGEACVAIADGGDVKEKKPVEHIPTVKSMFGRDITVSRPDGSNARTHVQIKTTKENSSTTETNLLFPKEEMIGFAHEILRLCGAE